MDLMSFSEALKKAGSQKKKHILLGNGFSIACKPDIFIYGRLFAKARFDKLSPATKKVFDIMGTEDFEKIIKVLRDSSDVLQAYDDANISIVEQLLDDSEALKDLLVETLAASHPLHPGEVSELQYQSCRLFLNNFEHIYTLNYDLLLYWTCMHCEEGQSPTSDDGFRKPADNYDADYVTWEPNNAHGQSLFFLHGALHLFDAGYELRKFTWVNTKVRLIEQIRNAMSKDLYPVFVSEGTSKEKIEKIRHNDYLAKAYRSFSAITGALFIYGHSLAENDEHFLTVIENGRIRQLYIGIFGNPNSNDNKRIIRRANKMALTRKKQTLEVYFYDVSSANVWG
ncbi:DUF4917 family protein [Pantoea sp. B270]|uniref:DUF4917 family protein n=1 Tax=Pantoea sp. B270 TaxID=2836826 RepID=UPI001BFFB7A9|nr:DUF4917 family protein [Pantoea sp. B270]MBU6517604.1 DUF4917 family protein [Pantoea sp. B270]